MYTQLFLVYRCHLSKLHQNRIRDPQKISGETETGSDFVLNYIEIFKQNNFVNQAFFRNIYWFLCTLKTRSTTNALPTCCTGKPLMEIHSLVIYICADPIHPESVYVYKILFVRYLQITVIMLHHILLLDASFTSRCQLSSKLFLF